MGKTNHYKHKEFLDLTGPVAFCYECMEYVEDIASDLKLDNSKTFEEQKGIETHVEPLELTEEQEMAAELRAEMGATR